MPTNPRESHPVRSHLIRTAALAAAAASLAACSDTAEQILPTEPGNGAAFMQRYAAIGNSITAGYQSGGILDSTQKESYARLLALQAGTGYVYASIPNGCAPPLVSFQTGTRVTPTQPCGLTQSYPFLNNVAVPGATVADFVTPYSASYSGLTSFILGGKSQWRRAMDVNPTFVSVWLGNNDVLNASVTGVISTGSGATANPTGALTTVATFTTLYKAGVDSLVGAGVKRGVLIGVVDVSQIPLLFPAESLITNPTFKAYFDAALGSASTVDTNCVGSGAGAHVSLAGLSKPEYKPALQYISCVPNKPAPGLGQTFILDATEQAAITSRVNAFNGYIKAKADSVGFAYWDPNTALGALRAANAVPSIPDLTSPTPFGLYISLDGVHPSGAAHVLIANALIDAINAKYGSSIPKLSAATTIATR